MKTKICGKCKKELPVTEFYKDNSNKTGLRYWCKNCVTNYNHSFKGRNAQNRYYKTNKFQEKRRRYKNSLKGMLRDKYAGIKDRCNNPKSLSYKNYGGRGIKNKFKGLNEFREYCLKTFGKINYRRLWIDRINNNGHYEKGNIRFITVKENLNNRRRYKNA